MLTVQHEFAQARATAFAKFETDLTSSVPDVAKAAGVKIVAYQLSYLSENADTTDITAQLVEKLQTLGN